ncbi:MAG: hypothetical protein QM811_17930 [Pirellulales bacterium]
MSVGYLDHEVSFYDSIKARLIAEGQSGKFALIGDDALVGLWETYEDALQAGYQRFGIAKRFLVKKIQGSENILYFTRDVVPAQSSPTQ